MIGEQQENAEELHAVNPMIVQQVCCRRAFLRGTFQASGSMSDPNKAYHLRLSVPQKRWHIRSVI